jgi:hypothetical protein
MNDLKIAVRKQPAQFQPGEEIAGAAQWRLDHAPKAVEVRLLWHTSGRGIEDVCVVETVRFDAPEQDDTRSFSITTPNAPHGFSGRLITLEWALELVALPSKENARTDLVIAPHGRAIDLRPSSTPGADM